MRRIALGLILQGIVLTMAAASAKDPVSGTWSGDWGPIADDRNPVTVQLKLSGKSLTGTVNPGANAVAVQKGTFDSATGAVHMEATVKGRGGNQVHFVIEGKVDNGTMSGTWNHGDANGDFKIMKKG